MESAFEGKLPMNHRHPAIHLISNIWESELILQVSQFIPRPYWRYRKCRFANIYIDSTLYDVALDYRVISRSASDVVDRSSRTGLSHWFSSAPIAQLLVDGTRSKRRKETGKRMTRDLLNCSSKECLDYHELCPCSRPCCYSPGPRSTPYSKSDPRHSFSAIDGTEHTLQRKMLLAYGALLARTPREVTDIRRRAI